MRSVKPSVVSASNAVTLAKLQLKVLMGITADVDLKADDNLANYETALFAGELSAGDESLINNTTMKQFDLNHNCFLRTSSLNESNFLPNTL